jgi:hypothetical protein
VETVLLAGAEPAEERRRMLDVHIVQFAAAFVKRLA